MSDDRSARVAAAFDSHDSLTPQAGEWAVTTTTFDATVAADPGEQTRYTVTVRPPTLGAATVGEVGEAVAADWLRAFRRRLEDAPTATRASVELDDQTVAVTDGTVRVMYTFTWNSPSGAADIAKTLAEFVEGTYVEGIVPGYEYERPVADLLAAASQGENGGTPL